jgi:hypothetical protein
MGMGLSIGSFSEMCGIPTHTLRRLHIAGKFLPSLVTSGGHRRYDLSQLNDVACFRKTQELLPGGQGVIDERTHLEPFFAYLLGLILADGTVLEAGQVQLEMKDEQLMSELACSMGVELHRRPDRPMYRLTVPRSIALELVAFRVCRRKCEGFDIRPMSKDSFGHFLRGLFDGDGNIRKKAGQMVFSLYGHPKSMAHIQRTLFENFGWYLHWYRDNRTESGMLQTSRKSIVSEIFEYMYSSGGICLERKKKGFEIGKEEELSYGNGINICPIQTSPDGLGNPEVDDKGQAGISSVQPERLMR